MQHTTSIFRRLYDQMPPLVPDEVRQDMKKALEQVESNMHLSPEELEQTMIFFAKKLWPYREAFSELYRVYEGQIGEQFLLKKFSGEMKKKYELFMQAGGTLRDLHTGSSVTQLFSSDERTALCEALVDMQQELISYVTQKILSTDRRRYEDRVQEFMELLRDIEGQLDALRSRADEEQEHPELAAEIREHIRGFEHGLSLLGPRIDYEAVCQAHEFFDERKKQKKIHAAVHG